MVTPFPGILDGELVQLSDRPLAEANGDFASDSHPDGENHVEVVVEKLAAGYQSRALGGRGNWRIWRCFSCSCSFSR